MFKLDLTTSPHSLGLAGRAMVLALGTSTLVACSALGGGSEESELEYETGCLTELVTGQTFALPQAEGDRTFQADASFDGEAIWLTHAGAPLDEESIVVSALRIHCDGSIASPALRLAEQTGLQTEPKVTSSQGQVLVAWQRDDQVSVDNLSTHYMVFDREQGPTDVASQHLDTKYQGASAGNTWMPQLSASSAGFAIAGLRGVSDFNAFQAFAQRLDHEGVMLGEAINGELQDEKSQDDAEATLGDDGSLILSWSQTDNDDVEHMVHVEVEADGNEPTSAPIRVSDEQCSQGAQAGSDREGRFVAFSSPDGSVGVTPSTVFNEQAPVLQLKAPGGDAMSPAIAMGPEGGAVAWLQPLTGYNAEIHLQGFTGQGFELQLAGTAKTIQTDEPAIGPYRVSMEHIEDSVYMVTWTEGPITDLQVKWRFVDFADAEVQ